MTGDDEALMIRANAISANSAFFAESPPPAHMTQLYIGKMTSEGQLWQKPKPFGGQTAPRPTDQGLGMPFCNRKMPTSLPSRVKACQFEP